VAQIHQRIKQYIKQYTRETRRTYQWPRRHSFHARINGLLVETGRRAEPEQRGARLGTSRGFSERVWVRLGPEAATRPEWADPLGYLIILKQGQDPSSYQKIRAAGRVLAVEAPVSQAVVPVAEPVIPVIARREPTPLSIARRRPAPARDVSLIASTETLRDLEAQRQAHRTSAEFMSVNGVSPNAFERLWGIVREFNTTATRAYGQTPFPDLAEALGILQSCVAALAAERQITQLSRAFQSAGGPSCSSTSASVKAYETEATLSGSRVSASGSVSDTASDTETAVSPG
jgi:hypothetical protein